MIQIEFDNKMREQNIILKKVRELYGRRMSEEKQKLTKSLSEIEIAHRLRVIELLTDEEIDNREREIKLQKNLLEKRIEEQGIVDGYNMSISVLYEKKMKEEEDIHKEIKTIAKAFEKENKNNDLKDMISEMSKEIDRIKLAIRFKM